MANTKVEVAFELTVGDTPYFRLNDPVKGKLNNTSYRLAGPIWIDITNRVANVNIKRGKNRELDRYSAGVATITLHNEDRAFDPLNDASPYVGNIIPRRAVRVSTADVTQFTGVIDDWNLDYSVGGKANAVIVASDAFSLLAQQSLTAGTATAQTTGERINAVLSMPSVAWPLTQRNIDTGSSQVGADVWTTDNNVLTYLQKVEASEQGQLFMNRDGYVRFVNGGVTPETFGDWELSRRNLATNVLNGANSTNIVATRMTLSLQSGFVRGTITDATAVGFAQRFAPSAVNTGAAVTAGQTYTISAYGRTSAAAALMSVQIFWYQANGTTLISTSTGTATPVNSLTFTRMSVTATAPAGAVYAYWYVGISGTGARAIGDTVDVQNLLIEASSVMGDYFDGSTTPTTTVERYAWTGTANASTSTKEIRQPIIYPTFSDQNDGIPYTATAISYGTELLYNQVAVKYSGGTETASNAISQAKYGITGTEVDTLLSTNTAAQSLATFWVTKYGEPEYRFQDIEVSLDGTPVDKVEQVLNIELGDIVFIKFTPNNVGSAIERYGQIIKKEHSIGVDRHNIMFGLAALPFSFLELDSTSIGILDENVLAF